MSVSLNDSIDSSESLEEKTNDTGPWIPSIIITNEVSDEGSQWDSADVWLAVVIVLLSLLILVNILVYIKCVRSVNRSLCDTFNDLIFFVFGIIVSPPPTKDRTKTSESGPPAVYNTSSTSVEIIEGIRPTPCCCFGDRVHQESETASGENPANNSDQTENSKEEKIVDLRVKMEKQPAGGRQEEGAQGRHKEEKVIGGLRVKMENRPAGEKKEEMGIGKPKVENTIRDPLVKMENQPVGQKDNLDRYLGNLNVVKNTEKVFKKVKLQTVPEEQVSAELGSAQSEGPSVKAEPTYASVIKPPSSMAPNVDAAIVPDPEIFI